MTAQPREDLACPRVPDNERPIGAGCGEGLAIGRMGDAHDRALVLDQGVDNPAVGNVPNQQSAAVVPCQQLLSIGRKLGGHEFEGNR